MKTVNVYEAKTNLSGLLADVQKGETITIARAGKPVAVLTAAPPVASSAEVAARFGFMAGAQHVPDDFDTMYAAEIAEMFGGGT